MLYFYVSVWLGSTDDACTLRSSNGLRAVERASRSALHSFPTYYTTSGIWECASASGGVRHSSLVVVDSILDRDTPTSVPITVSNRPRAICPPHPYPRAFTPQSPHLPLLHNRIHNSDPLVLGILACTTTRLHSPLHACDRLPTSATIVRSHTTVTLSSSN